MHIFHYFFIFLQGQRKVASREALWGGLFMLFFDFLGFWGLLGEPIWRNFLLKIASGADSKKRSFFEVTVAVRLTPG